MLCYTGIMRKSIILRFLFLCLLPMAGIYCFTDRSVNSLEIDFLNKYITEAPSEHVYRELYKQRPERAEALKKQADTVALIFKEVLKTEKQLVPKQCNYLIIYGYENSNAETLKKADHTVRLAVMANMDRATMKVFIAGTQEVRTLLRTAVRKTGMPDDRVFEIPADSNSTAARQIIPAILTDITEHRYNMDNLLYRRILLLTKASNTRTGYAAFVAALADNTYNMILDDFSTLDIDRKQLDSPSAAERERAFMELKTER